MERPKRIINKPSRFESTSSEEEPQKRPRIVLGSIAEDIEVLRRTLEGPTTYTPPTNTHTPATNAYELPTYSYAPQPNMYRAHAIYTDAARQQYGNRKYTDEEKHCNIGEHAATARWHSTEASWITNHIRT